MTERNRMHYCVQEGCDEWPMFRFTWPGKDEAVACLEHTMGLQKLTAAIGARQQFIRLTNDQLMEIAEARDG